MKPLVLLPGKNVADSFDTALAAAYNRAKASGKVQDEPNFVRELISTKTIVELNTAASNAYDENINSVRFAGVFIHGHPQAEFNALNGPISTLCLRELADAMIILNETAPNNLGIHQVIRRSACLLMFKTKAAKRPRSLKYDASKLLTPQGTDQEQFHLFSAWPSFELNCGGKVLGPYSIAQPMTSANRHNHSKFGVLWSPSAKVPCGWGHKWRYSDPLPAVPISDSLGLLLSRMADADPNNGREYQLGGVGDWDKLIVDLQSYANVHAWGGGILRSANPAKLSFIQAHDTVATTLGTIGQHIRAAVMQLWQTQDYDQISHFTNSLDRLDFHVYMRRTHPYAEVPEGALPVLSVTVSSFRNFENLEPMDQRTRLQIMDQAASQVSDLWRRLR